MYGDFNTDLLKQDLKEIRDSVTGFFKSFGPSPKQYSFREESKIKFNLWLVDLGPVKIIKIIIGVIVFLLMFFVLFIRSDIYFRILEVVLYLLFYAWLWKNELEAEEKDKKISIPGAFVLGMFRWFSELFSAGEKKK